ncbi:MAG: hypothetical protein WKG03_10520 [Telluria sp.]
MTVCIPLAWLLAIAVAAPAAASSAPGLGVSAFTASDSEGFDTHRLMLHYLPLYASRYQLTGVTLASSRFSQDGWQRESHQLGPMYRRIDPLTLDGLQVDAGYNRQGGHGLLTMDATYHATLAPRRSVELFFNRDWVETRRALDGAVAFSYAGATRGPG